MQNPGQPAIRCVWILSRAAKCGLSPIFRPRWRPLFAKRLITAPVPDEPPPKTPDNPHFDALVRANMQRNAGCPRFGDVPDPGGSAGWAFPER